MVWLLEMNSWCISKHKASLEELEVQMYSSEIDHTYQRDCRLP
jgi:hypothetical protein